MTKNNPEQVKAMLDECRRELMVLNAKKGELRNFSKSYAEVVDRLELKLDTARNEAFEAENKLDETNRRIVVLQARIRKEESAEGEEQS